MQHDYVWTKWIFKKHEDNKNIPLLPLPAARIAGLAQL